MMSKVTRYDLHSLTVTKQSLINKNLVSNHGKTDCFVICKKIHIVVLKLTFHKY